MSIEMRDGKLVYTGLPQAAKEQLDELQRKIGRENLERMTATSVVKFPSFEEMQRDIAILRAALKFALERGDAWHDSGYSGPMPDESLIEIRKLIEK